MRHIIILTVILALQSSIFIVAGLRILTAKRPFIVNWRWQVILLNAPYMASSIYIAWPKYPEESWLPIFLVIGCLIIVCGIILWQFHDGIVIGTTRTALRDGLRQGLQRLSLPYEESAQAFRLPTLNNELTAEATAIDGIFALRLKSFRNRLAIRQLAAGLNDFFRTAPVRTNRRASYALIVIGAVILLTTSWLTYERLSLQAEIEAETKFFKSSEK